MNKNEGKRPSVRPSLCLTQKSYLAKQKKKNTSYLGRRKGKEETEAFSHLHLSSQISNHTQQAGDVFVPNYSLYRYVSLSQHSTIYHAA